MLSFFLSNRIFKNVVKNFVEDNRCEVHQTILGIREGKEGWFEMFCLSGIACDDDGEMFSLMVIKKKLPINLKLFPLFFIFSSVN
jgi:hypothetical protein